MNFKKICHINLVVSNMEDSINFYTNNLGFRITFDNIIQSKAIANGAGFDDVTARIVMLELGAKQTILELFHYIYPEGSVRPVVDPNTIGQGHFAIEVTDIEDLYLDLCDKGVNFLSEPQKVTDGVKFCYFRDPDGALLELIEFS